MVKISAIRKWTLVLALISIGRFLSVSLLQVLYPVDLIFESPTWNTALLLHRGVNIYSPQTYDAPPFNLNLYTPLYFAVVSIVPGFSQAPLVVGRTVSLFFAFCCLAVLIITISPKNRLKMGIIGIGWLLLFSPVLVNAAFFRMEFMALFFSACAVASLRNGPLTAKEIAAAAFFSCLAVMSKQTSVAAPVACFLYLLWSNRRQGFRFAAFFSLMLGGCLFYLYRSGGEGFLWSILIAPKQALRFEWFAYNFGYMSTPSFFALVGLSAAASYAILASLITRESSSGEPRPGLLNAVYYLTSWIWLLSSVGKLGASTNYFIEPLFASVWLLLTWVDTQKQDSPAASIYRYAWILLPLVFAADVFITRKEPNYLLTPTLNSPERFQRIKQEMQSLGIPASPKILNLGQATHSLSVGWDLYLNDPVLYMLLWNNGVLSNRSLVKTIDEGYFDLIAVPSGVRRQPQGQQLRPMQEIFQHVFDRYELKSESTFDYYVPRAKSGSQ